MIVSLNVRVCVSASLNEAISCTCDNLWKKKKIQIGLWQAYVYIFISSWGKKYEASEHVQET